MPKSHPPYAPEFRQRIVELVLKGRTPEELARQFGPRRRRFATRSCQTHSASRSSSNLSTQACRRSGLTTRGRTGGNLMVHRRWQDGSAVCRSGRAIHDLRYGCSRKPYGVARDSPWLFPMG